MSFIFHKQVKQTHILLHLAAREDQGHFNSLEALLHNLESFFLNIYEQTVTTRSKRTTSCYKHLKIASDSESYWENTLHLPPAYESIAFILLLSFLKRKKNDEYV